MVNGVLKTWFCKTIFFVWILKNTEALIDENLKGSNGRSFTAWIKFKTQKYLKNNNEIP
jgi:hypothetical protein